MRNDSPRYTHGSESWDTSGVLLSDETAAGAVNLQQLFGNDHPIEIEIGSGKGTFLLARAQARPEVNLLGIEWARAYCTYAADRIRRQGLTNVRMLRTDAGPFFRKCLPAATAIRLHIYFPDPWPKRKHHPRRLIQPAFLAEARRVLRPGGELLIVTDHMGYFEHIRGVLAGAKGWANVGFPQMADRQGELVGTNFERKYIAQGRRFYNAARLKYILPGETKIVGASETIY